MAIKLTTSSPPPLSKLATVTRPAMDSRDTAPDSWEQEDEVEAPSDAQLQSAFTALNVNAKPFVPNINAPEFVPAFFQRGPSEDPEAGGKMTAGISGKSALACAAGCLGEASWLATYALICGRRHMEALADRDSSG